MTKITMNKPKYEYGDKVKFSIYFDKNDKRNMEGYVFIVDAHGTFDQQEEPSYDVFAPNMNTLFKHLRESGLSLISKTNAEALQILQTI